MLATRSRVRTAAAAGLLAGALALLALAIPMPSAADDREAPRAAAAKAKPPKQGKYRGLVGTTATISFKVKGRSLRGLAAGVNTVCQRASDGFLTRFQLLAINLKGSSLRLRRAGKRWAFSGEGQDANDVAWKISGKISRKGVARGTFEASKFYFLFPFDGELCSASGNFVARSK
jgi:hypothetical protein